MGHCTAAVAVTAVGFTRDDRRAQHALRQIVGGFQLVDMQETQEMRTMFPQAFGKAGILPIGEAAVWQSPSGPLPGDKGPVPVPYPLHDTWGPDRFVCRYFHAPRQ